jgi:hypothetical protein
MNDTLPQRTIVPTGAIIPTVLSAPSEYRLKSAQAHYADQ